MIKRSIVIFLIAILSLIGCIQTEKQVNEEIKESKMEKIYNNENNGTDIQKKDNLGINENKEIEKNDAIQKESKGLNDTIKVETEKSVEKRINGKLVEERLEEALDRLHTFGSGQHIRNNFPDIELLYSDNAENTGFPRMILPFRYYYSKEANRTFNICNIDLTVFICKGKLDRQITNEDIDSSRCEVTPTYKTDPRLGGSGVSNYEYYYN